MKDQVPLVHSRAGALGLVVVLALAAPHVASAGDPANLFFPLDASYTRVDFFGDGCTGNRCASGPDQHNDDDSASVPLGFTFDLYGEQYTTAFVNNNGNLSFATFFSTFTSSGFPTSTFKMVAGFWADVDTGTSTNFIGDVWHKLTDNTLVVIWDNVGYFSQQADKRNTFEIAISDGTNPSMGLGNNVCLSYDDMQWTTASSSGGSGGFGGTPATVGANRGNGTEFFQIGRFDHEGADYDGPGGNNDGVSYLDGRSFCFRTSTTTTNIAPIATGFPAGNVVTLNPLLGQTLDLALAFLSPEGGQTTNVTIVDVDNLAARGLTIGNTPGNVADVSLLWTPTCDDTGAYALDFTARDDFLPPGETQVRLTIQVICASDATATPSATPSPTITPPPGCQVYSAGDLPKAIPDQGQVLSTLSVAQAGQITAVSVLGLRGTHSFVQDLQFHLISPSGSDLVILDRVCGGSANFNVNLDDLAATAVPCPPTDAMTHLPSNPLSIFNGQVAAGTWTLRVEDQAANDSGELSGWGLQICFAGTGPTLSPTPTRSHSPTRTHTPIPTSTATRTRTATSTASATPTLTAAPGCDTYFANDVPRAILDLGEASSGVAVNSSGTINSVSILALRGRHTFVQDLEVHLRSPSGRDVVVMDRVCGGANDFNLNLDDLAATTIPCPPTDGGFHLPSHALGAFGGDTAAGTWTLRIVDRAAFDDGVLDGWGLQVCTGSSKPTLTATPTRTPTATPGCAEFFAGDAAIGATIPDLGTLRSQMFVPLAGNITSVSVRALSGVHTYMQDLEFRLISPAANQVTILDRVCGSSPGFQFELDDLGTPLVCPPFDALPHLPSQPLSSFIGEPALGTWTLDIYDRAGFDEGLLLSWGLYICVGGGPLFTATPTGTRPPTLTPTPSRTRTRTPTFTPPATSTATRTFTPSITQTPVATPTATLTPTGTLPPSPTATRTPTATATASITLTPTLTRVPKLTFTPTRTPSASPSSTPTRTGSIPATATRSPTQTATGSMRPPKLTFTPTLTPTRGAATLTPTPGVPGCEGDCNDDGQVGPAEVVVLINAALTQLLQVPCANGDFDHNGRITIDEIVRAVNSKASDCGARPMATPTRTPSGTMGMVTATPTITQPAGSDVARPATGAGIVIAQGLRAIPAVISSLTQLARSGSSSLTRGSRAPTSCNGGGTRDFTCSQAVPGVPPRDYALSFASCGLNTANGGRVIVDGAMSGRSSESGFLATCSLPPLALSSLTLDGVRVQVRDAGNQTQLDATFNLTGSAVATPDLVSSCRISAFEMTVSGSATVTTGGLEISMGFNNTTMKITVQQFSADCVPVRYTMAVNGPLTLNTASFGELAAIFSNFIFGDDTSGGGDLVTLDGTVQSGCFPAPVTYATDTALALVQGSACPTAGVLRLSANAQTDKVVFTGSGGVNIDRGNNGSIEETYPSCIAAELRACGG